VTTRYKFTKEVGLALQADAVTHWAAKLRPEVLQALKDRIQRENDNLRKGATGYDVFRGYHITNVVLGLKIKGGKWV